MNHYFNHHLVKTFFIICVGFMVNYALRADTNAANAKTLYSVELPKQATITQARLINAKPFVIYTVEQDRKELYHLQTATKNYGPYREIMYLSISHDGLHYSFAFNDNGRFFVQTPQKKIGPFSNIESVQINNTGKLTSIFYQSLKKQHIQINDTVYGPYDIVENYNYHVVFSQKKDVFAFAYKEKESWHIKVDKKDYGPMSEYLAPRQYYTVALSENGDSFGFAYYRDRQKFMKIDAKRFGPLQNSDNLPVYTSGGYYFVHEDFGKKYININGQDFGPFEYVQAVASSKAKNGVIYSYRKNGLYYVKIDNKEEGPFSHLRLLGHNDDIHKAKDLVSYVYQKNEKDYFQINEKTYGPVEGFQYDTEVLVNSRLLDFVYLHQGSNKKFSLVNSQAVFGPANEIDFSTVTWAKNNSLAYAMRKDGATTFVQMGTQSFGPYSYRYKDHENNLAPLLVAPKFDFFLFDFIQVQDRKILHYLNVNGQVSAPLKMAVTAYDNSGRLTWLSIDQESRLSVVQY